MRLAEHLCVSVVGKTGEGWVVCVGVREHATTRHPYIHPGMKKKTKGAFFFRARAQCVCQRLDYIKKRVNSARPL
jgi:hypothetical protein